MKKRSWLILRYFPEINLLFAFFKAYFQSVSNADLAQLVEQLTCNQQVVGSNPTVGSILFTENFECQFLQSALATLD